MDSENPKEFCVVREQGALWGVLEDRRRSRGCACFVNRVDILLWAVGWKAFNERGVAKEMHFILLRFYLFIFRGEEKEKEREISMCVCLSCAPYWGPGPQPRRVP